MEQVQKGINTNFYKKTVTDLAESLKIPFESDSSWVTVADKTAAQRYEKLDAALSTAKSNLDKPATRAAYFALGDYYIARGEFASAAKNYMRCRDDCTDAQTQLALYLRVVRAHMLAGQYTQAAGYASRAERAADSLPRNDELRSMLAAVQGVAALYAHEYRKAARLLASVIVPVGDEDEDEEEGDGEVAGEAAESTLPETVANDDNDDDDNDDDVDDKKNENKEQEQQKAEVKKSCFYF